MSSLNRYKPGPLINSNDLQYEDDLIEFVSEKMSGVQDHLQKELENYLGWARMPLVAKTVEMVWNWDVRGLRWRECATVVGRGENQGSLLLTHGQGNRQWYSLDKFFLLTHGRGNRHRQAFPNSRYHLNLLESGLSSTSGSYKGFLLLLQPTIHLSTPLL